MAGPIQTAIGQMLGAFSGATLAAKKLANDEGQAKEEKQEKPESEAAKPSEQKEAAKAYKIAQDRGATSTERIIFDEKGQPLGTYDELSVLVSRQALENYRSSRRRTKSAINERKKLLSKESEKEEAK